MGDGLGVPKQFRLGPGAAGANVNEFNEITNVASGSTLVVVQYTVPPTKTFFLTQVEFSGENIATYEVYINNIRKGKKDTYFSGALYDDFFFNNLEVAAGIKIELRVTHDRPDTADFAGRILGGLE
jgi:hypothetical protein